MRYLQSSKLYCFSPPVMIATFFIEIILAVFTIVKYKLTPITRLASLLLVGLAVFQLAEWNVCEGSWGVDSLVWARVGYVAITALPPLGLHLITKIAGKKDRRSRIVVASTYVLGLVFAFIFLFVGHGLESQVCQGNYVIFLIAPWAVIPYFIYYFGLTIGSAMYAWSLASRMQSKSKKVSLLAMSLGYGAFIIPTTVANLIDPSMMAAIPSVMCGFAVIFAITLAGFVVPRYYSKRK